MIWVNRVLVTFIDKVKIGLHIVSLVFPRSSIHPISFASFSQLVIIACCSSKKKM